ncbi:GrpB family protein [Marinigracilibium pacificum]|uniref:GrpB family protein n=1 Tax=Marinigracilibium pacificum TaxID=2729599 RepID=A0A848IVU0_9BACT|nr:GrpB family protein [Marinigracilibium pacificum]NMM47806.1 GrpB family protein [Marinigracilibium pacificum]
MKKLQDLTKEEWNTHFPLELVDHNPEWKNLYQKEKDLILNHIDEKSILRIEHFGSSSIPSIKSKPYIDIIIEIPEVLLFDVHLISKFSEIGYTHFVVPKRNDIESYSSFGKGYNLENKKDQIFHIHMCPKDNIMWKQIEFRDYLIANKDRAKAYEKLKLDLISKYQNDRGAYVLGKTDFVFETLELVNR